MRTEMKQPRIKFERACRVCGASFRTSYTNQKSCSLKCRLEFERAPYVQPYSNIPTGTVGAIGELRVCCDLLAKGFEVFRAVSQACSCDLIISKGGTIKKVEVRTGYVSNFTGKRYANRSGSSNRRDVIAICYPDSIIYEPELQPLSVVKPI